MTAFDAALATLHADENVSLPATFRRGGRGQGAALRITRDVRDDPVDTFGGRVAGRYDAVNIRIADAATVGKDDTIEILDATGGDPIERLVITEATLDAEGLTWQARVRRM